MIEPLSQDSVSWAECAWYRKQLAGNLDQAAQSEDQQEDKKKDIFATDLETRRI